MKCLKFIRQFLLINNFLRNFSQQALKRQITDRIRASGGTYIGCGLKKGIEIFTSRQTKNPISALLLLTDGQDNEVHDYSQLMQTFPEDVVCHTFGYGPDNSASLLTKLAEQGNGGTFTYVVSSINYSFQI
jgi:secreted protein with Ig-like and vWFA domain